MFKQLSQVYVTVALAIWSSSSFGFGQSADLPQTNMGRYVHQPGYNQYDPAAQNVRHGYYRAQSPNNVAVQQNIQTSQISYTPTPRPVGPDVSIEPIPADEPIPAADFPPLPDRADLPCSIGSGQISVSSGAANTNYPSSASAVSSQPANQPPQGNLHQHYAHVQAGAYIANQRPTRSSQGQDTYNVNNGNNPVANPANMAALNNLGPEPKLGSTTPGIQAQAPTAVVINQSKTQDLSLPDDDYTSQGTPKYKANKPKMSSARYLMMPLYMGAGMGLGMGMSFLHY